MGGSGRNMSWLHQLGNLLVKIAGAFAAFLVIVDVVYNNWELINYLGNAQYLLTPLLNHPSLVDVAASYAFPKEASPVLLSEAGRFQLNDTITAAFGRNPDYYFLTAGGHLIQDASYDICGALAESYPNVSATAATVNLGVVTNSLFYVRGTTLSNFFGMTATDVAPPKSNDATLTALGYAPARLDTDMKLTTPLAIPPSGTNMTANVTMYRFFPKSFCTGCSSSSAATNAASSTPYIGDTHLLGVILERSSASKASFKPKDDPMDGRNVQTPWYKRLLYIFSPPLYRYSSDTYSLPDFFLNSDVVVFGYTVALLLDEKQSMVFTRQLAKWVQANDGWAQIQLFAIQFRWLWLNCAVLKCIKWFINFMSLTRQTGKNPFVGMCNFSSVIYVYIGAVFLVTRTSFIHYGNSDSVSMSSTTDCIDTVRLDLLQSQYIRAFPSLILVMIVNLMAVLALDHAIHFRWWRRMVKNSLSRQAMFNTTSILTDMHFRFHDMDGYKGQAIAIHARSLTTIQWFLSCHTVCFGLSEESRNVRAMVSKVIGQNNNDRTGATTIMVRSSGLSGRGLKYEPLQNQSPDSKDHNSGGGNVMDTLDEDEAINMESGAAPSNDLFILAQDTDGNIHLYDARKTEIQAMSLEVKILSDGKYIIA
ncbi:hypothetical protein AeMF1_002192 [Aphanomyces euteiches]|nr:hypothetical protein AeMF1_002192 [Aphanomyces euteiches]KAH9191781.1 hypothetical protein AeNC1_006251 [Aphanomyces euteiches]